MGHAELRKAEKAPMNGERTGRGERELRGRGRGVGEAPMSPLSRQTTSAWEPVRLLNSLHNLSPPPPPLSVKT